MRSRADAAPLMTLIACMTLAACAGDAERTAAAGDSTAAAVPSALATALADAERAELARLPAGPGHDLVVSGCLTCHGVGLVTQQRKDTAGWNKTVTQMVAWGAPVPDSARATLVTYLAEHYPAAGAGPSPASRP
jgi:cytochrome c5